MESCDVFVAGGGPAGSACAWKLRAAGFDVVVADKAIFPRDKVCAGWITPPVLDDLRIDPDEYRSGRTLQPIDGFRVGVIGGGRTVEATYGRAVSFGIRRCEFDTYLLRRSGARLMLGAPIETIRRESAHWIVNETIRASMLVGAGGHFCPVARMLNAAASGTPLIAAHEVEFAVPCDARGFRVAADKPELYFCRDFSGYGWCFRKQQHVNIGFGRLSGRALPSASAAFVDFLKSTHKIPADTSWRWRGHAYLLGSSRRSRIIDDGVVLIGDAAGLAYSQSGEGILPAIQSGLMAASAIVDAGGQYTRERLQPYANLIDRRFGNYALARALSAIVPSGFSEALARNLIERPWFVRRVVLDRWFLHLGRHDTKSAERRVSS